MSVLAELTERMQSMYQTTILMQMKNIGTQNRELLEPYRGFLEEKREDAALHDIAQACLDTLEGRT